MCIFPLLNQEQTSIIDGISPAAAATNKIEKEGMLTQQRGNHKGIQDLLWATGELHGQRSVLKRDRRCDSLFALL